VSRRGYLSAITWPDSSFDEPSYSKPDISAVIDIIRNHGSRLSRIEEILERIVTNGTSPRLLDDDDPPCEICGEWTTNGRLCPSCERKFPWF